MGLTHENADRLRQGIALLGSLSDDDYARSPALAGTGPVGGQVRHIIDGYRCLLRGLPTGCVDYDRRERNVVLEVSREAADAALTEIIAELDALDSAPGELPLRVRADRPSGLSDDEAFCDSTLSRELMALASHTIHHFAIIAISLRAAGRLPPSELGVAPSTLRHWRATSAGPNAASPSLDAQAAD